MKPNNRVMCPDCIRPKMLFETERKAENFIKWNAAEMKHGESLRAYYCPACCGWHISHQEHRDDYEVQTRNLVAAYNRSISLHGKKKIDRLIHEENYDAEARRIFDDLPEEVQHAPFKKAVRKYLKTYFSDNGMKDDGFLRTAIYKIWQKNNNRQ